MIKSLPQKLRPFFNKTMEVRMVAELKGLRSRLATLKETLDYLDSEADEKDEEQILEVWMCFGPGRRGMDHQKKPDAEGLAERMLKKTLKDIDHLKKKIAEMPR